MIETTGEGKSAVATPDGKKPKEEEVLSEKHLVWHNYVHEETEQTQIRQERIYDETCEKKFKDLATTKD